MALIPGDLQKIDQLEVQSDAPVSEATFTKIGASINAIADSFTPIYSNTVAGADTFLIPGDIERILVWCAGGGGGGAGGESGTSNSGGGGGQGSTPYFTPIRVTPGETINITVGAGGAGGIANNPGSNGGDTVITSATDSAVISGGLAGQTGAVGNPSSNFGARLPQIVTLGGNGGTFVLSAGLAGSDGQNSMWNLRGVGAAPGAGASSGGGGGGGGASLGAGGGGGAGGANAVNGSNGLTGGIAAGGGGAGGGGNTATGGTGGNGGAGFVFIYI